MISILLVHLGAFPTVMGVLGLIYGDFHGPNFKSGPRNCYDVGWLETVSCRAGECAKVNLIRNHFAARGGN